MSIKPSAGYDSALVWTKSSYSTPDGPDCVEVAAGTGRVLVRDSKDPQGPRLAFGSGAWEGFVAYAGGR